MYIYLHLFVVPLRTGNLLLLLRIWVLLVRILCWCGSRILCWCGSGLCFGGFGAVFPVGVVVRCGSGGFVFDSLMVSKSAEICRFLCIWSTFPTSVLTVWSGLRAGDLAA
ncbi:hypothetical protein L195_g035792 [Trifolium pratense]|uniref:Uncharacterized protein n=1 Tax=Trifolium pratense TaxID=57577 RepID=A0A2K3LMP7_TRIPR|nr:hypothetical protein L195_g035792 [Trifolium pratense]